MSDGMSMRTIAYMAKLSEWCRTTRIPHIHVCHADGERWRDGKLMELRHCEVCGKELDRVKPVV